MLVKWKNSLSDLFANVFFLLRMNQQHILINGNGSAGGNPLTLQQYLVNNHIQKPSDQNQQNQNVHVQIVKQEQAQQRLIINRQYIQQSSQARRQAPPYWLIVEIDSNNELNSYALVESKDVVGQPPVDTLSTGKPLHVNINGRQCEATVVMASSECHVATDSIQNIKGFFFS